MHGLRRSLFEDIREYREAKFLVPESLLCFRFGGRLPFAGREFNRGFLLTLPGHVDPCERGEFHTFAFDGPMFAKPIAVALGEVTERDTLICCLAARATADF